MSDTSPLPAEAYKVLADVLGGSGKVIAYRPYFAHAFGGACNALLLSQLWFWANTPTVKAREDGWFWKSQKEISQETGLTRTETGTARRKLGQIGVLSEEVRGVPATVHFRVNKDVLFERLWSHILANPDEFAENLQTVGMGKSQFAENLQTGLQNTRKLVRGKAANQNAGKLQPITETTPEKNQKKQTENLAASPPGVSPAAVPEGKEPEGKEPTAGGDPGTDKAGRIHAINERLFLHSDSAFAREWRRRKGLGRDGEGAEAGPGIGPAGIGSRAGE